MKFHRFIWCGAAAAAAWGAYGMRATPLVSVALGVIPVIAGTVLWRSVGKRTEGDMFQDLSVSTLVFPPESRPKRFVSRKNKAQ